ncbi:MAG TPA: protein kinase, partial [Aggregatilineales bacterium]|nr:protein kinase [Aggregatilineales bacterium]
TLAYMSPEVLLQGAVDIASDIYAVGIIAYEFLTGAHPFNTSQVTELIHNIINKPLDVSTLPHDLGMIILKMTAKAPKERYESADIALIEWAN